METKKLINYHIKELKKIDHISERTKNVCLKSSLNNLYKILRFYIKNKDFGKIKNCGDKSNFELIRLSKKYIQNYNIVMADLKDDNDNIYFERFKFYCFENYDIGSDEIESYREDFINNDFKLFQFVDLLLRRVLDKREYYIFEHNFSFVRGKDKMTLQAVSSKFFITRERVRQITQIIPQKIINIFSVFFLDVFYLKEHFSYNLNNKGEYYYFDSNIADVINLKESFYFTEKFYALIFSVLYTQDYGMFQDFTKNYKAYYVVKNELLDNFKFKQCHDFLFEQFLRRIKQPNYINFDILIDEFISVDDKDLRGKVKVVMQEVILNEFNTNFVSDNSFVIPRNTLIKLPEYIVRILKEYKRPMHLEEIFDELKRKTHKAPQNIESLRSSVLSVEEIAAIGKTSTYALKSWPGIKTGTIKELAIEFLDKMDKQQHISEIMKYIGKYRETSEKNVLSNLKLDKSESFVFFKGGYVGLASKKYSV